MLKFKILNEIQSLLKLKKFAKNLKILSTILFKFKNYVKIQKF